MKQLVFESNFAPYIEGLIAQKRAIGFKYEANAEIFARFDLFCLHKYPDATTISKEMAEEWTQRSPVEKEGTVRGRATAVNHLAVYMNNRSVAAYVFPLKSLPKEKKYASYIYSDDELLRIFKQTDSCHYSSEAPLRQFIMPVLFRMIYCCGLRLGEVLRLRVSDVDLSAGTLMIIDSKNDNDRIVPMSTELVKICVDYVAKAHRDSVGDACFFSAPNGQQIPSINIYTNYRRFLRQAGISHGGRGKGPRIYDLRHTFAVNCLRQLVREGKDLNAYYPVLKTYMGHSFFKYTAYYLKLTQNIYPEIREKLEALFATLDTTNPSGGDVDG